MPYKDNGNNPFSAARLKIIDKKKTKNAVQSVKHGEKVKPR